MSTPMWVFVGFLAGMVVFLTTISFLLGWTSPGTLKKNLAAQCDKEKIAHARQYDCHAKLDAVLHYKDGDYEIEWLNVPLTKQ